MTLLESYKDSIEEFKTKVQDVFKPINSEKASLSSTCERLSILAGYHMGLVQINQWLDIWANDMILLLEIEDDEDIFEEISRKFITMQLEMEQIFYDEFSSLFEIAMYDYKYQQREYSGLDVLTPAFANVCLVVDSMLEVLKENWSLLVFGRLFNKMTSLIEKEFKSCSVTRYDVENGLRPIISKRGVTFDCEKLF